MNFRPHRTETEHENRKLRVFVLFLSENKKQETRRLVRAGIAAFPHGQKAAFCGFKDLLRSDVVK